jgi:tetraacyldisaccharide 4'-kinase
MLGPTEFRELVSGQRRGPAAAALRGLLRVAETPYSLAVRYRNRRYDRGRAEIHDVGVPVISVGNLTLGGTGKTPVVKWIARHLQHLEASVVLLSRGYGASTGEQNDEARELAQALPNVPHLQNRDRVSAARQAISQYHPDVFILDDGFQHRRLARDLDIVLLDALEPFGFEHVFPRGTLREPLAGLKRADVVCLSRADAVSVDEREAIRRRAAQLAPAAAWCEIAHVPSGVLNSEGDSKPLEHLRGKRVAAFCAIGNPAGFRHTLASVGCEVVAWREFVDHHIFSDAELAELETAARDCGADCLVCTQKDLVKIPNKPLGDVPLWAVTIEIDFLSGKEKLEAMLERIAKK